jgi:flagellar hook-associated protein 3 FlgL
MSLRVPTSTTYARMERGLAVSLNRVQQLQGQLSSGSRISKLSDDAVGAAAGLRLRAEEADHAAYARTADDAQAALGLTDTALQSASTLLAQARQLGVAGTNGSLNAAGRAALADQIGNLREQLGDVANTQHLGRALFGGHRATAVTSSGTPPTYAYAGDEGVVSRQLSPSVTMPVNLDGCDVFGFAAGPGEDLFATLTALETAVRTGDAAGMTAGQDKLAVRTADVTAALGKVGAMSNRVTALVEAGVSTIDRLTEQRSQVEDIDLAATILRLQVAENGYTAALGAVAKADLPSLANFLH